MQNLSAGVILAAVGKELFPMMRHEGIRDLGVVAGFIIALCCMFGLQQLQGYLEQRADETGPKSPMKVQVNFIFGFIV